MILGAVFFDYETGNHRFAAEGVLLGLGLYYAFFVFRGDVGLEFWDRRMRNNIELICLNMMFLTLQVWLEWLLQAVQFHLRLHHRLAHLFCCHDGLIGVLKRSIFEHDATVQAHSFGILSYVETFHQLISIVEIRLSEALVHHLDWFRLQVHHTCLFRWLVAHVLQAARVWWIRWYHEGQPVHSASKQWTLRIVALVGNNSVTLLVFHLVTTTRKEGLRRRSRQCKHFHWREACLGVLHARARKVHLLHVRILLFCSHLLFLEVGENNALRGAIMRLENLIGAFSILGKT